MNFNEENLDFGSDGKLPKKKPIGSRRFSVGEQSFTLIETVIALGLMVTIIMEVSSVQGHAIYFSDYERKVTKATWLAKSVMSNIEYNWSSRDFKEMETPKSEKKFKEFPDVEDFTYSVHIAEWKLPIIDLLTGGGGGGDDEANPEADMVRAQVEKILGDEILKIAHVEVFWPDGAKRDSVSLALLLTNQKKLDEVISTLKPLKEEKSKGQEKKKPIKGGSGNKPKFDENGNPIDPGSGTGTGTGTGAGAGAGDEDEYPE